MKHHTLTLIALALALAGVLFLLPVVATAQAGGRTCQYDLECGVGEACNEHGRCVARGTIDGERESAGDECGSDRRCRIDRLKRKNNARRHARVIREEDQVRHLLEEQEEERLAESPRLADPLSADLRVSRLGPLGLHFGYVFAGHFQPEFEAAWSNVFVATSAANGGLDGRHAAWWFRVGGSYFLLDSWFSPYLSAGFVMATGRYSSFDFGFADAVGSDTQSRIHAGEFGGGVDLQFKFGMHTRLGMVYRPLIYNQARIGPGQYDPTTQQGLADWFRQAAAIDVIWLFGWAI